MKSFLFLTLLVFIFTAFSSGARAELVFESTENLKLGVNKDSLTCNWIERAAHAGTITYPAAYLLTNDIVGTKFKHDHFDGIAYLQGDFSCDPVDTLIASADKDGKIEIQKNVIVYVFTYQDFKNGPIAAVETSEVVRLILPNGNYLESRKSFKEKK